jgi:hypothetical protein
MSGLRRRRAERGRPGAGAQAARRARRRRSRAAQRASGSCSKWRWCARGSAGPSAQRGRSDAGRSHGAGAGRRGSRRARAAREVRVSEAGLAAARACECRCGAAARASGADGVSWHGAHGACGARARPWQAMARRRVNSGGGAAQYWRLSVDRQGNNDAPVSRSCGTCHATRALERSSGSAAACRRACGCGDAAARRFEADPPRGSRVAREGRRRPLRRRQ